MTKKSLLLLTFVSIKCLSQISGRVLDKATKLPIEYANLWIEKSWEGTTSDKNGSFFIENGRIGDTILVSHLGYQEIRVQIKNENKIELNPTFVQLDEVLVTPMKEKKTINIQTYKNYKNIREFNFFEHQSCARFFEYEDDYANTPFIKSISLAVVTPLKSKQIFRVYLIKVNKEGSPSNQLFSEYKTIEFYGDGEINVDFSDEKLIFPKEGFFVAFDILNLKENIAINNFGHKVLCPAIGMENRDQKKSTWLNYYGVWISPKERKIKSNEDRNVAINIKLSN